MGAFAHCVAARVDLTRRSGRQLTSGSANPSRDRLAAAGSRVRDRIGGRVRHLSSWQSLFCADVHLALKGPAIIAQGNALGQQKPNRNQALQGRAKAFSSPFQGSAHLRCQSPGRCPGLL